VSRLSGASLGKLLISQRFGMSAPKGKNGFVRRRIVSSPRSRRNIPGVNASSFNDRKIEGDPKVVVAAKRSAIRDP
jgi:hypothetical protein